LEKNPRLYQEFASLDGSVEACLKFAHEYGLLNDRAPDIETLKFWKAQRDHLKRIIEFCELGVTNPREALRQFDREELILHAQFDPVLSLCGPHRPPVLSMRHTSLAGAIQMQAVQLILGGRKSIKCYQCSQWFEIGSGARRSLSKFCSRRCKDTYHNRQKREGRAS
jgi:hypothetical protein